MAALLGAGSLNSSMNRLVLLALAVTLTSCAFGAGEESQIECAKSAIGADSLVRVDEPQKRFFVAGYAGEAKVAKELVASVRRCLQGHAWDGEWALSLFAERQLAGYKDEPAIIPFHQGDRWANGYLAEYDDHTRALTLFPVVAPQELSVPDD